MAGSMSLKKCDIMLEFVYVIIYKIVTLHSETLSTLGQLSNLKFRERMHDIGCLQKQNETKKQRHHI